MPKAPLLLAAMLPLAACSKPLLVDEAGKYRVVARVAAGDVKAALGEHGAGATVVAFDQAATSAIAAAITAAPASAPALLVTVGAEPTVEEKLAREVRIVDETGALAAVDLAVLWLGGVELPVKLPLGTRAVTAANRAAGGAARPAPGNLAVAMLGNQHPAILTTRPATDEVRPVGLICASHSAWHRRVAAEVRAAARSYPQLGLQERDATGDGKAVPGRIAELIELGCLAIVVSIDDPEAIAPAMEQAEARKVAVLVLDPAMRVGRATCVIGADQEVLGRTAAEQVQALLPAGGKLVLVDAAGTVAASRFDGFVRTLGLRAP